MLPGVCKQINTIAKAMPKLANVFILICFVAAAFAILGMQVAAGLCTCWDWSMGRGGFVSAGVRIPSVSRAQWAAMPLFNSWLHPCSCVHAHALHTHMHTHAYAAYAYACVYACACVHRSQSGIRQQSRARQRVRCHEVAVPC